MAVLGNDDPLLNPNYAIEIKFYQAFQGEWDKPDYFLGISRASELNNSMGVNFHIHLPGKVSVPISIKSSKEELEQFFDAVLEGKTFLKRSPVAIIINKNDSDEYIRKQLFYLLNKWLVKNAHLRQLVRQ